MTMLTGINRIVEHESRQLHVQCEDLGSGEASYEVRVYDGGTVLWLKRFSYKDLADQNLPRPEHEKGLRVLMEKTLQVVQAAIAKGKIG